MTQVQKTTSIANFLSFDKTKKFLDDTLKDRRPEFVSNLIAITDGDTALAQCEPAQLMKCALNAVALNLPLNKNLGYAYVIAYKGTPSFQIGYKGFIQMALRTGMYEFLNAVEVRRGEMERNKITGEIKFIGENIEAPVVGYIAYLKLKSGFQASVYMTEEQIEAHALRLHAGEAPW
jgi:recombination protein RecT